MSPVSDEPRGSGDSPDLDRILALLAGESSAEDRDEILERAQADSVGSSELDFAADLTRALEQHDRSMHQAVRAQDPADVALASGGLRGAWIWRAAAAVFVACLGGFLVLRGLSPPEHPATGSFGLARLDAPVFSPLSVRDPEDSIQAEFAGAMQAYVSGGPAAAREALEAFHEDHPKHAPARFYLAVCRESAGDDRAAVELYRGLTRTERESAGWLGDHAAWRLAHLLDHLGESERAREVLEELALGSGPFSELADELVDRPR